MWMRSFQRIFDDILAYLADFYRVTNAILGNSQINQFLDRKKDDERIVERRQKLGVEYCEL